MDGRRAAAGAGASCDAVLRVLRSQSDPMTIDTLSRNVGRAVSTVRFHLDHLVRDGLVTSSRAPARGPGRPRQVYRALAPEAVDGAAAYRLLAGLLAEELVRAGDTQAPIAAGRSWADQLDRSTPTIQRAAGEPQAAYAVRRVVELFDEGGFSPEWDAARRTIVLRRCPFMELATVRPEIVCGVHLGLVRGLLERLDADGAEGGRAEPHALPAQQVRLRPVLDGSGPCHLFLPARNRAATTTDRQLLA